jgi:hypothetical protein
VVEPHQRSKMSIVSLSRRKQGPFRGEPYLCSYSSLYVTNA